MAKLSEQELTEALRPLAGWERAGNEISKTFEKEDFVGAITFVQRVAFAAEKMNHHPDIDIRWNKVKLTLSTHSEGGLTKNDIELARQIEAIR
ncbi:MAG: 4a-hydroxytetrahydrobiopterin dehydratase [Acidobacteriota bacterium]